ncbi:Carcinine transporter-like 5 [Homarus americanus]|uniref:Carcinine transporter-like 5 n=1 Tax=Homarus americanus TaxID=6706 RepID=A0A8J5K0L8_HOMAM|nr:Carcinine transporter-like 5 [Homarus americanus]
MKRDLRDSERNETTTTMEQNSFENVTNGLASSTSPRAQERRDAFKKLRQSRQSEKSMDFDDLLPHVGEFGRYQKLLIFLICLPACIPCGFHAFNQLFMSPSPPHWCRVPELEGLGLTVQEVRNLSIPWEGGGYSQCSQYQLPNNYTPEWPLEEPRPAWPVVPCTSGWIYNTTIIYSSIVIDVFGLITAFAPNFWAWLTCRFLVGLTVPAIYQIPFIISLELVGPSYRSFVTVMTCLFYVGGMLLLAGVAYLVRNWVYLCLVTSLPFFVYVVYWCQTPYLTFTFSCASFDRMMAQQALSTSSAQKNSATGFFSMCYTPNMRLKAILITMVWFANETVYVGLSYYGPAMGDDEYLSFFLSCAVEVPSYLLCWIVMDRWGRASLATLVLYLVAKFSESAAFLIIYPFAAELYPTEVRGVGIGFSAYVGGLGLGTEMLVLPLLIMGVVSALGGVLTFRLPETLQQKLPNTMAEGEAFGHDFSWQECWACVPEIKQKEYEDFDHASDEEIDEIVSLENLGRRRSSEGHGRPDEATPLQRFGPLGSRANPLIRQTSIMDTPIITDASGAMKLTFWV